MQISFCRQRARLMCGLIGLLGATTAPAMAAPFGGALYETFGADGVSALDLANPGHAIGNLGFSATAIVAGGGKVYIESGSLLYVANPDLSGVTLFHNNGAAPAGLALDVADGILYESFGADGVTALDLANPSFAVGNLGVSVTNMVAGGGKVYLESGSTIYSANANLSGLSNFHSNGAAPAGLALDPADGILYETFGSNGVSALETANPAFSVGNLGISATNIVYGNGQVYLSSGNTIYTAGATLAGLTVYHTNGAATDGLAVLPPAAAPVPEPASMGLIGAGLVGLGWVRRRRHRAG